jgi:hypothetical protein
MSFDGDDIPGVHAEYSRAEVARVERRLRVWLKRRRREGTRCGESWPVGVKGGGSQHIVHENIEVVVLDQEVGHPDQTSPTRLAAITMPNEARRPGALPGSLLLLWIPPAVGGRVAAGRSVKRRPSDRAADNNRPLT